MSDLRPGAMSPDGQWTWNGSDWIPAFPGASQQAPVPPRPMTSREADAEQWLQSAEFAALFAPQKRRKGPSGCLLAGMIAGVVAVGLLILLAILVSSAQPGSPAGASGLGASALSAGSSAWAPSPLR